MSTDLVFSHAPRASVPTPRAALIVTNTTIYAGGHAESRQKIIPLWDTRDTTVLTPNQITRRDNANHASETIVSTNPETGKQTTRHRGGATVADGSWQHGRKTVRPMSDPRSVARPEYVGTGARPESVDSVVNRAPNPRATKGTRRQRKSANRAIRATLTVPSVSEISGINPRKQYEPGYLSEPIRTGRTAPMTTGFCQCQLIVGKHRTLEHSGL